MNAPIAPTPRVIAVVVAYQPDAELFARLIASVVPQVAVTLVVDNAQSHGLDCAWNAQLEHLDMGRNMGVASAQNAGIRRALELQASYVLLLDHDSVPSPDLVNNLLTHSRTLQSKGKHVAAVGAEYRDGRHANESPFVTMRWNGYTRLKADTKSGPIPVPFLISAGTLISVDALDHIGMMDERLFIDYVDIEWCLRARAKGLDCFGIPGATLEHRLGDDLLRWRTGGRPVRWLKRTIPSRSPLRHYYLFRNGCWLIFYGTMPLQWKLLELKRLFACFLAFASLAPDRRAQVKAMVRGIAHGFLGTLGPAH